MKDIKQFVSIILSVLMLCSVFTGLGITVNGVTVQTETTGDTYGDYTYTVLNDGTVEITDYMGSATKLEIPSTIVGYSVTSIGIYAFSNCESLISITIPNSVTSIGMCAFKECTSLTSITIPNSVTSINQTVFSECTSLTSITIPNSVTSIGYAMFSGCTSLTSITIPNSVSTIEDYAFYNCTNLSSITIPNSVISVGRDAFFNTGYYNNTNNWENNVLYIGKYLIDTKTSITGSYKVKEGTICIASNAFYNCDGLTSITIPNSVLRIGDSAFENCIKLTNITIPNSVISIGNWAFENTGYYNNTNNWEQGVLYIGEYLIDARTIMGGYQIKDGIICIADYAFHYCESLTSITIPNSVTNIGRSAFSECTSLTSITIPDSVTSIGRGAFSGCENLTIYGYKNSSAQQYANKNNVPFVSLNVEIIAKKLKYTKTIGSKAFNLNVKTINATKVTYTTSNKKVANVSSAGKVTIKGIGQAVITVKAQNTAGTVTKKIIITVKLKKVNINKVQKLTNNGKLYVGITFAKQKNISGYELQYANNKKFKGKKTYKIGKNKNAVAISAKSKITYLRIRSYKKVSGKVYYSEWTKTSA